MSGKADWRTGWRPTLALARKQAMVHKVVDPLVEELEGHRPIRRDADADVECQAVLGTLVDNILLVALLRLCDAHLLTGLALRGRLLGAVSATAHLDDKRGAERAVGTRRHHVGHVRYHAVAVGANMEDAAHAVGVRLEGCEDSRPRLGCVGCGLVDLHVMRPKPAAPRVRCTMACKQRPRKRGGQGEGAGPQRSRRGGAH